jgi:CBS domain-containing protein
MLFPIRQLMEGKPELQKISRRIKLSDALAIMVENDFSQLPIIDDNGRLTGIITEQSIINTYMIVRDRVSLLDMTVDHCQTSPVTISLDADIFEALDLLQKVYAVIAIENQKPVGILTDYDTTNFFRNYSEDLINIQDVEETLRQYIEGVLKTGPIMLAALMRAFGHDKKDTTLPARKYDEFTFGDHIQLIVADGNWEKFQDYFESKQIFLSLMDKVREARNQLAHFRGQLDPMQKRIIQQAKNWLSARPRIVSKEPVVDISGEKLTTSPTLESSQQQGKYYPLEKWLSEETVKGGRIRMQFDDIEKILGDELPDSSKQHRAWWSNDYTSHTQAIAWLRPGWLVDNVDLIKYEVTFRQSNLALYQTFFADLLSRLKEARPGITQTQKASLQNWLSFSAGATGFMFGWVLPKEPILRVELYIDTGDKVVNKAAFDALVKMQDEIEGEAKAKLKWDRLDKSKASRISISTPFQIKGPEANFEPAKKWGVEKMLMFVDIFQPRLSNLKSN